MKSHLAECSSKSGLDNNQSSVVARSIDWLRYPAYQASVLHDFDELYNM